MTYRYIADSYAWIAYFNKKKFRQIIENEVIETPSIVIAEITRTLKRKSISDKTIEKIIEFIQRRGFILPLDLETAKLGGAVANEEELPLIDGIIYSYIHTENDRLLTGDEHFKDKTRVVFEKE